MTDREDRDENVTSEDLVARAREQYLPSDETTAGTAFEATGTSVPDVDDSTVDEYADFLREMQTESSTEAPPVEDSVAAPAEAVAMPASDPEPEVEREPEPEPVTLSDNQLDQAWGGAPAPSEDSRGWDPNWTPGAPTTDYGGGSPVGGPDPSVLPPPPPGKRAPARSNRWLVGLLVFGGIVLFNVLGSGVLSSGTAVDDLAYGDCLIDPGDGEFSSVEVVECMDPHDYEVIADVEIAGSSYPGDQEIVFSAFDDCVERFGPYVGVSYLRSRYEIEVLFPSESAWDAGDRTVTCVVYEPIGSGYDPLTRRGSLRSAGR